MRVGAKAIAMAGLATIVGGCAGLRNGPPSLIDTRVIAPPAVLAPLRQAAIGDCLDISSALGTNEARQTRRNRIASAYLFAVDVGYHEYERNLLDSVRENDLGAASASLALSTIGSAVGIEELAQALDLTNALVTGTHTAIGRDYLLNQTLTTLQSQMRASRSTQQAAILERRAKTIDEWDECQALADVLIYEQAGTLNAAIAASAAAAASREEAGAAAVERAIERIAFTTSALGDALTAYFAPPDDDALAGRRLGDAATYLRAAGLSIPDGMRPGERLARVLDGANPAEVRALAIGVLRTEGNQAAKAPIVQALTQSNGG